MRGPDTLTVIRRTTRDRLKPGSGSATEHQIDNCLVIPRAANDTNKGWTQITGYTAYAFSGGDILATDQVRINDSPVVYSVEGEPGPYRNSKGKLKALVISLQAVR